MSPGRYFQGSLPGVAFHGRAALISFDSHNANNAHDSSKTFQLHGIGAKAETEDTHWPNTILLSWFAHIATLAPSPVVGLPRFAKPPFKLLSVSDFPNMQEWDRMWKNMEETVEEVGFGNWGFSCWTDTSRSQHDRSSHFPWSTQHPATEDAKFQHISTAQGSLQMRSKYLYSNGWSILQRFLCEAKARSDTCTAHFQELLQLLRLPQQLPANLANFILHRSAQICTDLTCLTWPKTVL